MIRTQIILQEKQRRALEQLARERSRSVSQLVRDMIDAQLRAEREQSLRDAAESLRGEYLSDAELTAFSAIDGDTFHEAR